MCNDSAAVGTGLQGRQVRVGGGSKKKGCAPIRQLKRKKASFFFFAGPDKICCDPSGATLKGGRGEGGRDCAFASGSNDGAGSPICLLPALCLSPTAASNTKNPRRTAAGRGAARNGEYSK